MVVIWTKDFYCGQISEMLSDSETYRKLDGDQTSKYRVELEILVDMGYQTGVLSNTERKYFVPSSSRILTIYTLPKIHKD